MAPPFDSHCNQAAFRAIVRDHPCLSIRIGCAAADARETSGLSKRGVLTWPATLTDTYNLTDNDDNNSRFCAVVYLCILDGKVFLVRSFKFLLVLRSTDC